MSLDGNLVTVEPQQSRDTGGDFQPDLNVPAPDDHVPPSRSFLLFAILGFVLPVIALAPLLVLAARGLWNQPTFQFFPISILLSFSFLFATCGRQLAGRARGIVAISICLVGIGIGLWGMILVSPSRAHLAFVFVTLGWAIGAFGSTPWTRIVSIISLIAITVPLPLALSFRFQNFLFRLSGAASSTFLEAVQFPNVLEQNLLRIEGKQLILTEVLLDAGSCFALAACAMAWSIYQRKPALVALLVLLSSFFWSFIFDSAKLLVVALLSHSLGVDASFGFYSIILSVIAFLLAIVCIILTSASLSEALAPIKSRKSLQGLSSIYEEWVTWPKLTDSKQRGSSSTTFPPQGILGLTAALSLVMSGLCFWVIFVKPQPQLQGLSISKSILESLPGRSSLPDQFGPLKLVNFSSNEADVKKSGRLHSRVWQYNAGETQFVVSLEFPYANWTSMADIYRSKGWELENSVKENQEVPGPWTLEHSSMRNNFGVRAYSWDAFFDQSGNPVSQETPQAQQGPSTLFAMIRNDRQTVVGQRRFCVRLFLETGREISEDESKQYQEFFLDIFDRIRSESVPALSQLK